MIETEKFIESCIEKYESELNSYPYNINIIDELHANENAHSRILSKILQYRDTQSQTYPILESFLNEFKIDLQIHHPNFECEESLKSSDKNGRIDLYVEDKTYTLIVENKINGATDQEEQLNKYIQYVFNNGKNNIYVLYLSKDGSEPTSKSLSQELKIKLNEKNRFRAVSYQNILYWLENTVLPHCKMKEEVLVSALKQYIDHLKGLYFLRPLDHDLKEAMKSHIYSHLSLSKSSDVEKINNIYNVINELKVQYGSGIQDNVERKIGKILDILGTMRIELIYEYFQDWREKIKTFLKNENHEFEVIHNFIEKDKSFGNQFPRVGINFKLKGNGDFCFIIEQDLSKGEVPYLCFWTPFKKDKDVIEFLNNNNNFSSEIKMKKNIPGTGGYFYSRKCHKKYDEIYDSFENVCSRIIEELKP